METVHQPLPAMIHAPTGSPGGTERRNAEMFAYASKAGYDPLALLMSPAHPDLLELYAKAGCDVRVLGHSDSLRSHVGSNRGAIFHGVRPAGLLALRRGFFSIGPKVIAENGLHFGATRFQQIRRRAILELADAVVVNSEAVDRQFARQWPKMKKRRFVVVSAMSGEWFEPLRRSPSPVCRFLMVGNASQVKNHLGGLEAFARLHEGKCDARLTIFTDTDHLVRPFLRTLGQPIRDSVRVVTGHILRPGDYDKHDVLLQPSLSESRPRAVMEAKARGLTVIATDVGDTKLLLSAGDHLVWPGNVDMMTQAMRSVLRASVTCQSLVETQTSGGHRSMSEYVDALMVVMQHLRAG